MTREEGTPVRWPAPDLSEGAAKDVDWNAAYADQLPRIYNYFRFRVSRQADVEDLTARTFEKAWKGREQYRRDLAGFSTWLFSIARNVATDYLRAMRVHLPLDAARDVATADTPEEAVARGSDIARLALLTAHLPDRQRELLALKYGAALNNRLIARITGLSESNVGTILQRTVEKLRSQW
ncbi:MAG TPA: sigma-70 family RNA polymerase sigma factor [Steroidobacteraceae bacterium]|nr:sigma-70 family RNA polymerase sigma factor [Steroidobacteraceae bacterium]